MQVPGYTFMKRSRRNKSGIVTYLWVNNLLVGKANRLGWIKVSFEALLQKHPETLLKPPPVRATEAQIKDWYAHWTADHEALLH